MKSLFCAEVVYNLNKGLYKCMLYFGHQIKWQHHRTQSRNAIIHSRLVIVGEIHVLYQCVWFLYTFYFSLNCVVKILRKIVGHPQTHLALCTKAGQDQSGGPAAARATLGSIGLEASSPQWEFKDVAYKATDHKALSSRIGVSRLVKVINTDSNHFL